MRVEVVAVGTELLLGQIVDTNSSWIGQQLAAAGLNSHFQTKVGDNPARIKAVLAQALDRSDAIICCGGLGPTQDDLTRDVIADLLGVELELDEAIADRIRRMFTSRGRTMPENNLRQAMVPAGSRTMSQQPGTAPGLVCPVPDGALVSGGSGDGGAIAGTDRVIYAVPGVPYEMKEMVDGTVVPDLVARSGRPSVIRSRVLRTWGASESGLAESLAGRIEELDQLGNPTIAFLASGVEGLKVRITVSSSDEESAAAMLAEEEELLRQLMGPIVFAVDDDNMETVVIRALGEQGLSLAVAESVTGGYIAGRLCAVPGASKVFRGAVVAYHTEVKASVLEVPDGPVVTEGTALAMAEGVRRRLGADIGLATTGVAGPDEAEGKPVGTVCYAISGLADAGISSDAVGTFQLPGDRERIRQFSTISILDLLRRRLG